MRRRVVEAGSASSGRGWQRVLCGRGKFLGGGPGERLAKRAAREVDQRRRRRCLLTGTASGEGVCASSRSLLSSCVVIGNTRPLPYVYVWSDLRQISSGRSSRSLHKVCPHRGKKFTTYFSISVKHSRSNFPTKLERILRQI